MNHHDQIEPSDRRRHPLDEREARVARRERLRLLCEADRTRLRLVWRLPAKLAKHRHDEDGDGRGWMGSLLTSPLLAAVLPVMPGRIGRWSRRLRAGLGLLRGVRRHAF